MNGGRSQNRLYGALTAAFVVGAAATALGLTRALPASGEAGPPREDPATFIVRTVGLVVSDKYAAVWPNLYPSHQEVAPRAEYIACEMRSPVGWKLESAEIVKVVERARRIPGDTKPKRVTAVTLRLVIVNRALHTEGGLTHTFNAVAVGSHWTWILTPSRYELYRSDSCGAA